MIDVGMFPLIAATVVVPAVRKPRLRSAFLASLICLAIGVWSYLGELFPGGEGREW